MPGAGAADWDTSVLGFPLVVDADPSGHSGPLAASAAAAFAAAGRGDEAAAADHAGVLGTAGVVAIRSGRETLEVWETSEGWELAPSAVPTPDVGDLGAAALVRAQRLAEARHAGKDRR